VPPQLGAFVVNIGDLMALWTNDRWVSTLHRVVNPPLAEDANRRRQSFAFFHQPNWDAEIATLPSCLAPGQSAKYAPVFSGPYLMSKFKSTTT
jgi:isopenicillin N synthase-like dioxygenase